MRSSFSQVGETSASSCSRNSCQAQRLPTRQLVLPFSGRSADSTIIISLILETAIAHRKGEHVMKEREALES